MTTDAVTPRLEELRRKLLDLTRRNRLLNFRLGRRSSIRVVDELAAEVFRILVVDGKTMNFLSVEEAPPEAKVAPEPEVDPDDPYLPAVWTGDAVPLATVPGARHRDTSLQTAMEGERLQARLTHLARESRSALEEQGCNTLYLALGIVRWQEGGAKGPVCEAPLVFVPVELRRKNVQSRYGVAAFDDDVIVNPCLAELCRRQFGVTLPELEDPEDADLDAYFARVSALVARDLAGWSFEPEINLGLFSFAKYLMYRDLDPASWPAARALAEHALVQKLCGLPVPLADEATGLPDPGELDAAIAPGDSFQVVDADSSQTAAILAAKRGKTLVIEGPPGTGKSQTITNIIAECLAAGRSVLFVAEKAAALEVVKRRLDRVGLGDFALEMHSRFSKRRAVLDELRRSLARADEPAGAAGAAADDLARLRQKLNTYVSELHAPAGRLGASAHAAIARAADLADAPEAACELPDPHAWEPAQLDEAGDAVERLDRALAVVGPRDQHPWRGAGLTAVGVEVRQRVSTRLRELGEALAEAAGLISRLSEVLKRPAPATPGEARRLVQHAQWLCAAPRVPLTVLEDERWDRLGDGLAEWIEHGVARAKVRAVWSRWFRPEAEEEFWGDVLERRRGQVDSWLRYVQPSWYADSRRIQRARHVEASPHEELQGLKALVESTRLRAQVEADLPRYRDLLGPCWEGLDGDWELLGRVARTVREAHRMAREDPLRWATIREIVPAADREALAGAAVRAAGGLDVLESRLAAWTEALAAQPAGWLGADPATFGFESLRARLEPLAGALERLDDWAALEHALAGARAPRLASFAAWALSPAGERARGALRRAFERQVWAVYADRAMAARETLRAFRGEDHHALVERFRKADVDWIRASRQRLIGRMRQRQPDLERATQRESRLGQLKAQMKLKRGGVSLRKLFEATGDVVQAIKPCFMMSPISVAQYLTPGAVQFDVVIFDEASQVEPADAFGAVARGRQLLLIGDDKQLPPTNFFGRADGPASADSVEVAAADQESILDVGRNVLPDTSVCSLRWHYRSLHQSLITFSNERFYDGKLRVFPSPHADRSELGLVLRYVSNGVYRRGEGQYNVEEARAVAHAVIEHARRTPGTSLGVGAFSTAQQRAIEDELERLRRRFADDELERFFQPGAEPFFVKNLETIQGDERDVIFLSVGYGKDAAGELKMNFGPLNREGGWRRLNVLVTRARRRCEVFSSIKADDIDLARTDARGVAALKEYLRVAELGAADALTPHAAADGPPRLEVTVARALEARGYAVHVHVGAAGFHVDVAVVDPDRPGRYLLGVECDGETYMSAATARDRDRLRMEVLVSLGWSVARLWAADWFRRPALMLDQLVATIEELRRAPRRDTEPRVAVEVPALPEPPPDDDDTDQVTLTGASTDGLAPYVAAPDRRLGKLDDLLVQPDARLIALIAEVVATEAPVHEEHVVKTLASWFDTKAASRARTRIRQAISAGARAAQFDLRDQFLWRSGETVAPVRFRGGGCPVTRPEHIALEEFAQGALQVVQREFGLPRAAMVQATLRLLGFRRGGPKLVAAAEQAIDWLILNGRLHQAADGALAMRS